MPQSTQAPHSAGPGRPSPDRTPPAWVRALRLGERLTDGGPPPCEPSERARERLAAWRRLAAFRDDDRFAENVRTLGTDPGTLLRLLDEPPEELATRIPRPSWATEDTDAPEPATPTRTPTPTPPTDPVFLPLVAPAIRRAESALLSRLNRLGADAPAGLADALLATLPLDRLDMVLGPTLVLEVNVARVEGRLRGDTPEERFASFAGLLADPDHQARFRAEYPVLVRQAAEVLDRWSAACARLARHLRDDLPDLRRDLLAGRPADTVRSVALGEGDLHHGGRSVARVEFACGGVVMYKPRSLAVDAAFGALAERFSHDTGLVLRAARVLDRKEHGWAEYIRPAPCSAPDGPALFYRRTGALLALVHALRGSDLYYENVIAAGDHPVLIDLEALFHPGDGSAPVWSASSPADADPAGELLHRSVLATGLLPGRRLVGPPDGRAPAHHAPARRPQTHRPQTDAPQAADHPQATALPRTTDLSGIGGSAGQPWLTPVPVPVGAGTDEVRLLPREVEVPGADNRPSLPDGSSVDPGRHLPDLLAGFRTGYDWLTEHRAALLAPGGPVDAFADAPVRYLHRDTYVYDKLLRESFHPDFARDALDRERSLARLCSGWAGAPDRERIVRDELDALLTGDIPLFRVVPGRRDLLLSTGGTVPGFLARDGLSAVREGLAALGPEDRDRQEWIITTSFTDTLNKAGTPHTKPPHVPRPSSPGRPADTRALTAAAEEIGDRLLRLAVTEGDAVGWLGTRSPGPGVTEIVPLGPDLYGGLAGIGLFLLRLAQVTGVRRFRDQADRVADEVARRVTGGEHPDAGALYLMSHDLKAGGPADRFRAVRDAVLPALRTAVAEDTAYDVIDGAAGYVLMCLAAYAADGGPESLEVARLAADHLAARAEPAGAGLGWRHAGIPAPGPLTGLAHGTSGAVVALSRLNALHPDGRYGALIDGALAYEAGVFEPDAGNWPDLREHAPVRHWSAWCHGAAGVGLARAELLMSPARPAARADRAADELRTALGPTLADRDNHSLCHGGLGNLELLLYAERLGLARPGGLADRLSAVLERARRTGWRSGAPAGEEVPGLFTGLAGIGHNLLRFAAPDDVPSVLLLEPPPEIRTAPPS
ncbi:type 2 lanthipeptide synthetase LanM family protein [Streptomyces mobaraensis]|uniref:type 2 lanthipeptide synthetase LanM family protein n=1 Tax=Streptomyces mobaraensis TaxID=35621 RepID=UPI00340B26CA